MLERYFIRPATIDRIRIALWRSLPPPPPSVASSCDAPDRGVVTSSVATARSLFMLMASAR